MALTPMMQQYFQVKEKCKDCILFFRLGDFYEMFFEDAEVASKELELVLTGRDCGLEQRAPMCGIPFHASNNYIGRLISKGYKVAICEQLEDPSVAKGIVKRDIIKIITPGTYTDSGFLEDTKNNYIMSLYITPENNHMGICFTDISTGEFNGTDTAFNIEIVLDEISKYNPKELLIQDCIDEVLINRIEERFNILYTKVSEGYFESNEAYSFKTDFLNFNEEDFHPSLINSAYGLLNYILETQKQPLSNINKLDYYNVVDYLSIDINSRRNLELTETLREKSKKGSLLGVIDKTNTAMGSRRLRKWIDQPLINKTSIEKRLNSVEELVNNISSYEDLKNALKNIYDIERIIGKISSKSVNAKELLSLRNSISNIPSVKEVLSRLESDLILEINSNLDELQDIFKIIQDSIIESPSMSIKEGNLIKEGYNEIIDELRAAKTNGKQWIASLESEEKESTGIKSLKVGYNKVFGYYIEVTNTNLGLIPKDKYIRKQTLSNAERFITPELKEVEEKILGADDKLISLEYKFFIEIRDSIEAEIDRMKNTATLLADLDCLTSLATIALENNYCKPVITEDGKIVIKEGRHPVIENIISSGTFISNDTFIDTEDNQLLLITGPNMAGKSTYMRQVAIITLMAQMGSFVPAKSASIAICDKIFTRIGASDDLSAGKSTFMVEMSEVSNILKNATNNSLILLDEVGRGTSTYDGLSIAWSTIEYICNNLKLRSKTLFATHYHELTKLEGVVRGVKNYSVAVKELGNEIVFLRKIVEGGADQSYGIEVAKLAGLPEKVINRAKELLLNLENTSNNLNESFGNENRNTLDSKELINEIKEVAVSRVEEVIQINFEDIEKGNLIKELCNIDIMNTTPIDAFNKLYDLTKKAKSLL